MKRQISTMLFVASLGLLSGCEEVGSIPAGLGYSAQELCARVFVGKDDSTRVKYR